MKLIDFIILFLTYVRSFQNEVINQIFQLVRLFCWKNTDNSKLKNEKNKNGKNRLNGKIQKWKIKRKFHLWCAQINCRSVYQMQFDPSVRNRLHIVNLFKTAKVNQSYHKLKL